MGLDADVARALIACRYEGQALARAREAHLNAGARDHGLDGMPHSRAACSPVEAAVITGDAARARLAAQTRRYKQARRAAHDALMRCGAGDYALAFWAAYYMDGLSVRRAAQIAGVADRTAWAYKAQVTRAARG